MTLCNCLFCRKDFTVKPYRKLSAKFCSRKCKGLHEREEIKTICGICEKPFTHISSRVNKAKYCSRKCYHKAQKGRGSVNHKCKHCGKEFLDSPCKKRIYCSKACVNKSEKKHFSPKYTTVRKIMIRRNLINECQICGYKEVPDVLGIHHKDADRTNNSIENLMVVCPLCHSLIHHKHVCH